MQRTALLLLHVLLLPAAGRAATVVVARPRLEFRSPEIVKEACTKVDTACTTFDDPLFSSSCISRNGRWSPAVIISAAPRIVISRRTYELHERMHIADFVGMMESRARHIEARKFDTLSACESFNELQTVMFPDYLQEFVRVSMQRRDGPRQPRRASW